MSVVQSDRLVPDESFWDVIDVEEKEFLSQRIVKDCEKAVKSGIFIVAVFVVGFVWAIIDLFTQNRFGPMLKMLLIGSSVFMIPLLIDATVTTKRYIEKAKENRFKSAHVKILERHVQPGFTNSFTVKVLNLSSEEEKTAVVKVERGFYEKALIGLTGRFTMIEDEKVKSLVSPYWFIPDTDREAVAMPVRNPVSTSAEAVLSTEPAAAVRGEFLSDSEKQRVMIGFRKTYGSFMTKMVIEGILFLFGGMLFIPYIMGRENPMSISLLLCALMPAVAGMIMMTIDFTRMIFKHKKIGLLGFALWTQLNVFSLVPISGGNKAISYLVLALITCFNIGMMFFLYSDEIKLYKEIAAGRYQIKDGTVLSTNKIRRYIYPIFLISICTCAASDSNGVNYEISIPSDQYRKFKQGTAGSIVTFDDEKFERVFLRR